jgi:hypothetical protein
VAEEALSLDERVLRLHLKSGRFLSGVACGRWRFVSLKWPHLIVAIPARDGVEYGFRFECTGYPRAAATARPWDLTADAPLPTNRWPKGRGRVSLAFNPGWKKGTALYLPCDRLAIEGHGNWRHEHPALLWDAAKGICKYLGIIHELLNSSDYEGSRAA